MESCSTRRSARLLAVVSGNSKVVVFWRFEIPFSSLAFSSGSSPEKLFFLLPSGFSSRCLQHPYPVRQNDHPAWETPINARVVAKRSSLIHAIATARRIVDGRRARSCDEPFASGYADRRWLQQGHENNQPGSPGGFSRLQRSRSLIYDQKTLQS
jgi:hypothetical protein